MQIGLRVDVDTFRGTRYGVPNLLAVLGAHGVSGSFFFSVGPDNMGRHLWRLIRPSFFKKMWRSGASRLYGWEILLRGTLWPGPVIGEKLAPVIRSASDAGHEIGVHAWDHHRWQARIDNMDAAAVRISLKKATDLQTAILGRLPVSSAVPGWKCTDVVLKEKARFGFVYNSDCRGRSIFYPVVGGKTLPQPQVPVTLPTYDEVIGRNGITDDNYNEYLLSRIKPDKLNVLAIHAEVEGMACLSLFDRFVKQARSKGASFVPLGQLVSEHTPAARAGIVAREIPGREGWVSCQA